MGDSTNISNDEISIKELILKAGEYWRELWRNWLLIGLFCTVFFAYFMYQHFTHIPEYKADLTYMLNSNDDSSMTGFASLLGSFGLNRSSRGFSLDKLVELSKSRAIIQRTLFNKVNTDSDKDYLANRIIDTYGLHDEWEEDRPELSGFYFSHDSIMAFTKQENYVLKYIYSQIIGNSKVKGLMGSTYDEDSGILTLSFQSVSETLSSRFVNLHFEELKEFFISKTIEKQKLNYEILSEKTDSLTGALRSAEYELANFKDSNLGIYTRNDNLTELRLEGKIKMLYAGLAKALENKEIADFSLKYQTPFIQTIDTPIVPLGAKGSNILIQILKSLLLGGLLGSAYVIVRKFYRDAMQA